MNIELNNQPLGYASLKLRKDSGAHYTSENLAGFVASVIVKNIKSLNRNKYKVLDPAIGDGELIIALLRQLKTIGIENVEVYGFDTDNNALEMALQRIQYEFSHVPCYLKNEDFLNYVVNNGKKDLFNQEIEEFDIVISNPPYVRTQVLGAKEAKRIAQQFNLFGRVDLYHAFLLGIEEVLRPGGIVGVITSNRFMTTKTGASVRSAIIRSFNIFHVWDLGDTKLFKAAVLPCVMLLSKKKGKEKSDNGIFTSIYSSNKQPEHEVFDITDALDFTGIVKTATNQVFEVKTGLLNHNGCDEGVWRISTPNAENYLSIIQINTHAFFGDIGKIRVGVKTTADKVFIRSDWSSLPVDEQPEFLYPLITHHIANKYKAKTSSNPLYILYPHAIFDGKRVPLDLSNYPRMANYLRKNRVVLEEREYVKASGREWYEIWVPQNPNAWSKTKLVFRDISEKPTFWIDLDGGIVNGDCYWLICKQPEQDDLLWLAMAVGNSTFIEWFYDHSFNNKLYSGRRRFMTQYVEKFPIPHPDSVIGQDIIRLTKIAYEKAFSKEIDIITETINELVWKAFGLSIEEIPR